MLDVFNKLNVWSPGRFKNHGLKWTVKNKISGIFIYSNYSNAETILATNTTGTNMKKHPGNVSRKCGSAADKPSKRSAVAAKLSTLHSPSHCFPRRSSLGRCPRCSAGRSPVGCSLYEMQRSSPGSDRPLLSLLEQTVVLTKHFNRHAS